MKFKKINYIPSLYEKLIYGLLKHGINLRACPPRKLKALIYTKIDPQLKDEIAGVHRIALRSVKNKQWNI